MTDTERIDFLQQVFDSGKTIQISPKDHEPPDYDIEARADGDGDVRAAIDDLAVQWSKREPEAQEQEP